MVVAHVNTTFFMHNEDVQGESYDEYVTMSY
jgi:hypothetical protein